MIKLNILNLVTIGENNVIGTGSVVNRSIPENCVVVENPCKVIRDLTDYDIKEKKGEV